MLIILKGDIVSKGVLWYTDGIYFCFAVVTISILNENILWPNNFMFRDLLWRNTGAGTSLVAQWLRICLPMRGPWVRALVWEDPTCRGATKPVCHNYWACALEPASHNDWAREPQLLKPACLEPMLLNKRSHCNEKPAHCNKE